MIKLSSRVQRAILQHQNSRTYSFEYKCIYIVPDTLDEMLGSVMYVWDSLATMTVQPRATKKLCSWKRGSGGGGCNGGL